MSILNGGGDDATPLYKYDLAGPDAARFLSWLSVRDFAAHKPGRVSYVAWCDERGKVLDDGTITRFDERSFRLTSADPSWAWLTDHAKGFDVTVARTGAEGLQLLSERRPEILILDVVLPDMDGWKALAAIRADASLARMPVVVVTVVDDRNRGLSLGATDYFVKPIDLERMAAILASCRAGAAA